MFTNLMWWLLRLLAKRLGVLIRLDEKDYTDENGTLITSSMTAKRSIFDSEAKAFEREFGYDPNADDL